MVIKASVATQIDALVADLASTRAMIRDSAVARLTLLGGRAVDRLITFAAADMPPAARAAALRTLEAIGDPRMIDAALRLIGDRDAVVAASGVSAVRAFVRSR